MTGDLDGTVALMDGLQEMEALEPKSRTGRLLYELAQASLEDGEIDLGLCALNLFGAQIADGLSVALHALVTSGQAIIETIAEEEKRGPGPEEAAT